MLTKIYKVLQASPWLSGLVIVALLSPLLCNQRPLACKYNGNWCFPAFYSYTTNKQLRAPQHPLHQIYLHNSWHLAPFEAVVRAPIPYDANGVDPSAIKLPPFHSKKHPLGTDNRGRDTLAGLLVGSRVVCTIGLLALLAASLPGVLLGLVAGYYGDERLQVSRWHLYITLPLLASAIIFCYTIWHRDLASGAILTWIFRCSFVCTCVVICSAYGKFFLRFTHWLQHPVVLPLDLLIQRLAEVFNSFPKLITLTVLTAIWGGVSPSIYLIAVIAGLLSWPGIAAYVRAEMLRIRALDYIAAARLAGVPEWRVIMRHALPNAISPAYVAMALYAASAIMLESSLSFLGIRNDTELVSWGSMLLEARLFREDWWLAVFPGVLITLTIYALYKLSIQQTGMHTPTQS